MTKTVSGKGSRWLENQLVCAAPGGTQGEGREKKARPGEKRKEVRLTERIAQEKDAKEEERKKTGVEEKVTRREVKKGR